VQIARDKKGCKMRVQGVYQSAGPPV